MHDESSMANLKRIVFRAEARIQQPAISAMPATCNRRDAAVIIGRRTPPVTIEANTPAKT